MDSTSPFSRHSPLESDGKQRRAAAAIPQLAVMQSR
jgi:hypothetical protein